MKRSRRQTELSAEGWEIEVVDLRSVKPLDTDTVIASVARTGRLLCVGEAWPWGGVTAEVIARVASEGFGLLDVPPQRLNAKDTPVPYHPKLVDGASPDRPAPSPPPPERFKAMKNVKSKIKNEAMRGLKLHRDFTFLIFNF